MTEAEARKFLDNVEGETALFRALAIARPIGRHRHFHLLAIQNAILTDTNYAMPAEAIWKKLENCYNLDTLESIEQEADAYEGLRSGEEPPRTPSPSQNLFMSPYFREEFALPHEEAYERMVAERRVRQTPSPPSSPEPPVKRGRKRGRKPDKAELAGLIGGDSDSSALTQESGDEGVGTPRDSMATATDGGEDEEEDMEVDEPLTVATSPKPSRGRGRKRGTGGRGRGSTRGAKKQRKR